MADGYYFSVDPDNNGDHSDGAAVLSNSWGFADGTLQPAEVVNAINYAATLGRNGKGCLILFAAANNDHTVNGVQAMGQLPTVLTVGGTNSNAYHTEFSDVGPEVGIATPTNDRGDDGVRLGWLDITTTDNTGSSGYNGLPDLDYTNGFGGTSSATPLAAGVLALIISQDETMTAAQARAILQHTAVRLDEPYGRFDGITSHSHRYGYGRADAGAAVAAAHAGLRWPDRIRQINITGSGNDITLTWDTPPNNYAGSLLVRALRPFAWKPTDGQTYSLGQEVAPGVFVVANGPSSIYIDVGASSGGFFYAAFPRSSLDLYGFGAKAHLIRNGVTLFYDNSESPDPGWTHGGAGDEWARGTPTSVNSPFGQSVSGSGPLAGLRGVRAINGNKCWGTDLLSTYNPDADAYLQTPLFNLTGVTVPVFLEYYDWCLLETYFDRCTVEVVDADDQLVGYLDPDTGGDYDWTQRVYDLTPFASQPIKIRFHIVADGILQRDGWFLDEVRVTVAANIALPPTAQDVYVETPENTPINITLSGSDPNPGTTLAYVITTLPAQGALCDPNGGPITSAPYTLVSNGRVVRYAPNPDYQGPDAFTYETFDGGLGSNSATVAISVGTPLLAREFLLNADPGWIVEGGWDFGVPSGAGGDPTGGFTGVNVYGYNLAGAYPNGLPAEHLTTLPFNCTGLSRVTLKFARWLGVEAGNYDNASIEATRDGVNWMTVWRNDNTDLQETAWSQQSYNIGTVADDQPFVQVRWTMGPTDGSTTFSGWNLDDIRVYAIGTPDPNQPPLAYAVATSTAKSTPTQVTLQGFDENLDPLLYTVLSLPEHGTLTDPGAGIITVVPHTLVGGNVAQYSPAPAFAGSDSFTYQVSDAVLDSNMAPVTVEVLESASFPLVEDFESGPPLAPYWYAVSTKTGRILVTNQYSPQGAYHVTLDSSYEGTYSLNELTLVVDLLGATNVLLQYDWKDFGDEVNALPDSWVGSLAGDGVAISADGATWHRVADLFDPALRSGVSTTERGVGRDVTYQTVTLDLDQAAAAAGVAYTKTFRIRFQQYDNNPIDGDGIALDNIGVLQGTGDPVITTPRLPRGEIDQPYGPVTLTATGGDLPLVWSTPAVYHEDALGTSYFATSGVGQNWTGNDVVYDYTLPFAFPFYGTSYTAVKIGTDGWINFGSYVGSTWNNSTVLLSYNKRIAPLWDDLRIDPGHDIHVDTAETGQVTFRWDAVTDSGSAPCAFSATLFDTGQIRFDYGPGNTPITATVGISAGDGATYLLSTYNGLPNLGDADSVLIDLPRLPPGISMSTAGVISGTPTAAGLYAPLFRVVDQSARGDEKVIPLRVSSGLYGDYDFDTDVDLFDFQRFQECLEQTEPSPTCLDAFDDDGDSGVNLRDFAAFQRAFTGG